MYRENEQIPTLLPPSRLNGEVRMRRKKIRLPIRAAALLLLIAGILSILAVGIGKISDGSVKGAIFDKLSGFLPPLDSTFSDEGKDSGQTPEPPRDTPDGSLGVLLPTPEDSIGGSSDGGETTVSPDVSGSVPDTGVPDTDIPSGAIPIADAPPPESAGGIENLTHRSFDTEYLKAMKTSVLRADSGPVCLIIHTHATESYLPDGTKYFLPSSGELARSSSDSENVVSVGKVIADTLNEGGIPTLHVTLHHDADGAGRAYVSSRSTVAYYLSKYPSIKYVIDVHRSADTDADRNILRDSFTDGDLSLARIRLTVSGGSSLADGGVNANLSLALKVNDLLCDYSSSLARPVLISDAVYCDGYAPRTLKIDIGSCASTLTEAKTSARILSEALIFLLGS
ncbi:MAG: stage II sporulation protein P [Clostridia bacterium]|nr:stage II sporulation protein P [Clostridia bacterium]